MHINDAQVISAAFRGQLRCLRKAKIIFNIHHKNTPSPLTHTKDPPIEQRTLLPITCYLQRHFSGTLDRSCLCSGNKLWEKEELNHRESCESARRAAVH